MMFIPIIGQFFFTQIPKRLLDCVDTYDRINMKIKEKGKN